MGASLDTDTIAAVATPPGAGGIGVVRISGPKAWEIARAITEEELTPRHAHLCRFTDADGGVIDTGIALWFPGPHSYTGEDVLELQGHGGPVVMNLLHQRVLQLGARTARPGEFSERAFLNDKLDLAQAEAVTDLIEAGTETAARAAQRSLDGDFSRRVHELTEGLTRLRVYVEAAIDFPDEEVDFLADGQVLSQVEGLMESVDTLLGQAHHGQLLRDGLTLALAGRPNAGKSSLLNALAGTDRAIVTEIAGTTRDVLREQIQIDGIPLHIIDTAGLRESDDRVEQEGVRRARAALETVDHVLLIHDESGPDEALRLEIPEGIPVTEVHNKIDLTGDEPRVNPNVDPPRVWLSAKTGNGIDGLKDHLKTVAGVDQAAEGVFLARTRHLEALEETRRHIETGRDQLAENAAGELLAEDLRLAQQSLGRITGEVTSDDLLGEIFSSFCIGK